MVIPAKIIECPSCRCKYQNSTGKYGLERGNEIWSDGYNKNEKIHNFPLITRCSECLSYFWISATRDSGDAGSQMVIPGLFDTKVSEKSSFPEVRKLNPDEFAETIALKKYQNPDEEIYLRTRLWWTINDQLRDGKQSEIPAELKTLFEENLETLIYKTLADSSHNLMVLAEMHRELGLFDDATRHLDLVHDEKYEPFVLKVKLKINMGDKKVFLL
jgi:hypothetical protein